MSEKNPQLLVVTGEASGDERAAELLIHLKASIPDIELFGMGGQELRSIGMELLVDIKDTAVFGLWEAISQIAKFKRIMKLLLEQWQARKPDAVLLVDFGGFNLRLAREIKRMGGRKTAYFISPQVWASRPGRARMVKKYLDLMMVLFPFEKDYYARMNINAVYVGHPLLDSIKVELNKEQIVNNLQLESGKQLLGFMPGSRKSEIQRILPVLIECSEILAQQGLTQFVIIAAPPMKELINSMLAGCRIPVFSENKFSVMAACDFIVVTSGTAALEAAILGVPAVVVYKTSFLTAALGRMLIKTKYISLPNIIAGEEIYPELLQGRCKAKIICQEICDILEDSGRYDRIRSHIGRLSSYLGDKGASARAANVLADFLDLT